MDFFNICEWLTNIISAKYYERGKEGVIGILPLKQSMNIKFLKSQEGDKRMKKFKQTLLLGMLFGVILLAACGGSDGTSNNTDSESTDETSNEPITLRAATGLSAQHMWVEGTMVPWMEKVEELTDDQVKFEFFSGGELVAVPDEAESVLNGTIDVGLILPIYTLDQYPMAEITMLPLAHSDTLIGSKAWQELLESDTELVDGKTYAEMQFADFKFFPVATTEEYSISTTGHEFHSVNDVKGTSLRTPSRIHEMYSEKIGVNSVTMPAVEMYDSLSRGAFEGSYYSISDWTGYGFQDLFRYTLRGINFGHFNAFIGMTNETWESLPTNVQEAMEQAYQEVFVPGAELIMDRSTEIIEQNKADGGKFVDFSTLDQEVQDLFNQGIEETWLDYAKLLNEQGLPGTELVKLWRDLIIKHGGDVPEGVKNIE